VAGALLVAAIPDSGLAFLLAAVVVAGVALTLFGWSPPSTRTNVVVAGAVSGVLGTATSIGGPPMALVWQDKDSRSLRGTMNVYGVVGCLESVLALSVTGAVDKHVYTTFFYLLPAAVVGFGVALLINRWLDERRLRWSAIAMALLGALILVLQHVV
jgi:uncharacterized protein